MNNVIIRRYGFPSTRDRFTQSAYVLGFRMENDKTSETSSMVQSEEAVGPADTASSAPAEEQQIFDEEEKTTKKILLHEPHRDVGNITKESEIKDRETGRAMDRFRHVRLVKVMQELERQKHMNSWKNSELNNKTRDLKVEKYSSTQTEYRQTYYLLNHNRSKQNR